MSEVCRACSGPQTVQSDEDIPLCNAHWNAFVSRYFGYDSDYPPCAAHLIEKESAS